MWWNTSWSMPWSPFLMIIFGMLCFAVMFVMMRMMHRHGAAGAPVWGMMACPDGHVSSPEQADVAGPSNQSTRPDASQNVAFDEYRAATLRRLEQEQRDFQVFLDHLRTADHKAEFDRFIAERGKTPVGA